MQSSSTATVCWSTRTLPSRPHGDSFAQEFDLEIDLLLGELAGVRAIDTLRNHLQPERLTAAVDRLEQLRARPGMRGQSALPGAVEITASLPAVRGRSSRLAAGASPAPDGRPPVSRSRT
ncbi:MAG: hypothetical protein R2710_28790 [Acidimicrobiales bacterium]